MLQGVLCVAAALITSLRSSSGDKIILRFRSLPSATLAAAAVASNESTSPKTKEAPGPDGLGAFLSRFYFPRCWMVIHFPSTSTFHQ